MRVSTRIYSAIHACLWGEHDVHLIYRCLHNNVNPDIPKSNASAQKKKSKNKKKAKTQKAKQNKTKKKKKKKKIHK